MEEYMSCLAHVSRPMLILQSQARVRSKNTAEMPAMVEALSFLGPMARLPRMRVLVFSVIPSMLLVFAWAQFMLALVYSLDCLDNSYC